MDVFVLFWAKRNAVIRQIQFLRINARKNYQKQIQKDKNSYFYFSGNAKKWLKSKTRHFN